MAVRASVNVSITPELEQFAQDLVASGRYHSVSEVFREGLRLLEHAERERSLETWFLEGRPPEDEARLTPELLERVRSQIQAKIQEGLDALDRGKSVDGEDYFASWKTRLARPADTTDTPSSV